jgi:pectate lyase
MHILTATALRATLRTTLAATATLALTATLHAQQPAAATAAASSASAAAASSRQKLDITPGAPVPETDWARVTVTPPAGAIPAFPGAEGAGSTTPGGRGGRVIYVTNLDDSGPGSLRVACEAEGPRNVLFQVSGLIALKKPIRITNPYITIAGQTAPGDGVSLKNFPLMTETHDIIVRHLRSRKGDETPQEDDALDVGHSSRDVIFDHCSATWSIDEAFSLSGNNGNITLQYCLIGEALRGSTHGKGNHGFGSLCRANGPVTLHHNLYIHNDGRNPRFGHNYGKPPFPTFDFRNNIIYDFGKLASGITQGNLRINYINNIVIPGASTANPRTAPIHIGKPSNVFVYLTGNIHEQNEQLTANNDLFISQTVIDGIEQARAVKTPFAMPPVATQPTMEAYETVLAGVGATLPMRDAVDARLVNHVRTRTGKMIDSQKDVGGWPAYKSGPIPKDTDNDGLPDDWEIAHNLNPADPSDGPKAAAGGYTNLEHYLNK